MWLFHRVAVSSRRGCAIAALHPASAPSRGCCGDMTARTARTRSSSTVSDKSTSNNMYSRLCHMGFLSALPCFWNFVRLFSAGYCYLY